MSNTEIVSKCSIANQVTSEGISLKDDKTWKSPPGGWLTVQSGIWVQDSVAGVALKDNAGGAIAFMTGLIFDTANENDTGVFRFDAGGDAGSWKVVATVP